MDSGALGCNSHLETGRVIGVEAQDARSLPPAAGGPASASMTSTTLDGDSTPRFSRVMGSRGFSGLSADVDIRSGQSHTKSSAPIRE